MSRFPFADLAAQIEQNTEVFRKLVDERMEIVSAIRDYHDALDKREHGGNAAYLALTQIQNILDMPWVQGTERKQREEKP